MTISKNVPDRFHSLISIPAIITAATLTRLKIDFLKLVFFIDAVYVTRPIPEFANGLSISILKISVFPKPIDVQKMMSRLLPSNDYSSSSHC